MMEGTMRNTRTKNKKREKKTAGKNMGTSNTKREQSTPTPRFKVECQETVQGRTGIQTGSPANVLNEAKVQRGGP